MSKLRVLLDTNVIVSGLVFSGGNEHRILKLAEKQQILVTWNETPISNSVASTYKPEPWQ